MRKRYERLFEMAKIGKVKGMDIQVYKGKEHNPPHLHAIKKDEFDVRITFKNKKVLSYAKQIKGKEISTSELEAIKSWLNRPHHKIKTSTNFEIAKLFWGSIDK